MTQEPADGFQVDGVGTQQRSPANPFDKHNLASLVVKRAQCRRWCALLRITWREPRRV